MDAAGEAFAKEVRTARAVGLPIVMVHENDEDREGCDFATFFRTTPQDLIDDGLYKALAIAFMSGAAHRNVSCALLSRTTYYLLVITYYLLHTLLTTYYLLLTHY